jgi:hypothetical protein
LFFLACAGVDLCANCKRKSNADFPIKGNVELGDNAEKLIAYFNVQHHVSYERKSPPKQEEKRLYSQLIERQKQLLLFLEKKEIPSTNNGSERALRNRVTKRKVSGCFRSEMGAYCNDVISSIIETAKKQKVYLLDALSPDFSFE